MTRIPQVRRVALVAIAALLGAAGPALGVAGPAGPAPLGKGWGRVVASGMVASVDQSGSRVQFAIIGTGTVDWFEGGTVWRKVPLSGTRTVRVLAATTLEDQAARALPLAAVRPGAAAMLWGVARPDAEMAGLILEVTSPPVPAAAQMQAAAQQQVVSQLGVVVAHSGSTIILISGAGTPHTVVMSATTEVAADGRWVAGSVVAPDDVVAVSGPMNSDGSVVATRIDVVFSAAAAARVSGSIAEILGPLGGLVVGDTMIATSAGTYVLRGGAGATLSDAAPGQLVIVYGIPVLDDAVPIGLAARVIVLR